MTAEVMALTAVQRAVAAWEDQTPDWVMALAIACDKSTQNRVAGRIGYSAAVVSNVLKAKYSGDLKAVEGAVKGALMNETVVCPVVGDLSRQACGEHRGVRSWRDLFPRRKRAAPVDNVVMFPPPPWGWGNDRTTLGGDAA